MELKLWNVTSESILSLLSVFLRIYPPPKIKNCILNPVNNIWTCGYNITCRKEKRKGAKY